MARLSTFVVLGLVALAPLVVFAAHRLARRVCRVPGLGAFTFYLAEPARAAPRAARLAVRATGPVVLYLYAVALVTIGLLVTGSSVGSMRVEVMGGSPARAAGVRDGDRVLAVDGQRVAEFGEIRRRVAAGGGRPVALRLERDGNETTVSVTPDARGILGIRSRTERVPLPVGTAVRHAVARPIHVIVALVRQVGAGLVGRQRSELAGPVGVLRAASKVSPGEALIYAGDLCGFGWLGYVLVALAATLVGESARPGRRPPRNSAR